MKLKQCDAYINTYKCNVEDCEGCMMNPLTKNENIIKKVVKLISEELSKTDFCMYMDCSGDCQECIKKYLMGVVERGFGADE